MTSASRETRIGIVMGITAYTIWGVLPLFIRLLQSVTPPGILSHRIFWSLLILACMAFALKRWGATLTAIRNPRVLLALCGSTLAIATNWLLYIYAVNGGHTVQVSLGYFINPLVNVLLGFVFLRERLGRLEIVALMLAATGVAAITIDQGSVPLISLTLAFSFAIYGLIRKMIGLGPVEGLLIETGILAPIAIWWLLTQPIIETGGPAPAFWLLVMAGVLTTAPLLLFAGAANRMRYSELGLLQYIGPTLQLLIAVQVFGEPLPPIFLVAFAFIWTGLAVYVFATWHRGRVVPTVPE